MTSAGLIILLAVLWVAVTGTVTVPNLVFGAVIGVAMLALLDIRLAGRRLWARMGRVVALAGLFVRELIVSALQVARLVLTPDLRRALAPGIVAFPLTVRSDAEITLLANLITLTPGTLSIDVSPDRRVLYVHAIVVRDREAFVRSIAEGFERRVAEVFK